MSSDLCADLDCARVDSSGECVMNGGEPECQCSTGFRGALCEIGKKMCHIFSNQDPEQESNIFSQKFVQEVGAEYVRRTLWCFDMLY